VLLVGHPVLANLVPNRPGDDAYHKSLHGTFNVPYLLELRENMVHYVHLIDTYAPSVVYEGMAKFNELAQLVKNDRVLRGKAFNHALYKVFVHRRRRHTKPNRNMETKIQKAEPYDDMDNDDLSDSDDVMRTNVIQV
jgi:hypothetical protein